MSRLPIRLRLTLAFALVMAVVLAALGFFVYLRVGDALLASVDQTLRQQASEAAAHASRNGDLRDRDVAGGTTLAQLLDARGRVIRSDPASLVRPLLSAPDALRVSAGERLRRSVALSAPRGDWRVFATPSPTAGPGAVVVVARSLEPREESLDHLLDELMVGGPLALLLASLAGYGLAAAALRPVEAMRRRAAAVSAPGQLPVPPSRDEISRLATTLNEMLARLEAAFEHERRFVADASHELRTPLALLRAEIEVTLRRPRTAAELEATLRSAAEETERLSRLAEDLLLIARGDRGSLPLRHELVAVEDVLAGVAERYSSGVGAAGRTLVVEDTEAVLDADPERLAQALGNLVENALAHGAGRITLFAIERGDAVELHVVDDGEGFPQGFLPRAFDRFSRGDEARGRGGTGLGLSIVELIASAHGGRAGAANRPEGGADVWVAIPRSAAPARRADRRLFT